MGEEGTCFHLVPIRILKYENTESCLCVFPSSVHCAVKGSYPYIEQNLWNQQFQISHNHTLACPHLPPPLIFLHNQRFQVYFGTRRKWKNFMLEEKFGRQTKCIRGSSERYTLKCANSITWRSDGNSIAYNKQKLKLEQLITSPAWHQFDHIMTGVSKGFSF